MDLVTGATGALGMHIVADLLQAGRQVRGLCRPSSDRSRPEAFLARRLSGSAWRERFAWVEGDVLDGFSLEDALSTGITRVFHAAALVSFHPKDAADMMAINRDGTAHLVDAMLHAGTPELVHISSVAALGRKAGEPVHEDTPYEDGPEVTPYGRSKHMAEREVWRGAAEGLKVLAVHPVIILGEGDYTRSSAALFPLVAKGLGWYPTGENGFVSASDVARASRQLAEQEAWGERFVLCAENRSYQWILSRIAEGLAKPAPNKALQGWMTGLGWRAAAIAERITGKRAVLTRESVSNTAKVHHYETDKLERFLPGWQYEPIETVIRDTAAAYSASQARS